jgi:acetoin utilization deacetylase AcuC-like enzyme
MTPPTFEAWRRRARRMLKRWTGRGPSARLVYHPAYGTEVAVSAYDSERSSKILGFLLSEKLVNRRAILRPTEASLRAVRRVHADDYLEALENPTGLVSVLGFRPTEEQRGTYLRVQRTAAGGTLLAANEAVAGRRVVAHLGGGFHHAFADRGQGFCVFNDVAVAIAELRSHGLPDRVVVIDLDVHDGDGTRAIFAADPSVHTFSIHNHDLGDLAAEESTSIALGDGVEDAAYLKALRESLPQVVERSRPGLVFYLAGCDPAVDDRLGNWRISATGMLERDRFVVGEIRRTAPGAALVILLAGGYGRSAWRYSARFLGALWSDDEVVEPPSAEEQVLARYRSLSRLLPSSELVTERPDGEWRMTDEDVLDSLTGTGRATRLLGFYSREGIELALERYGLMDKLRAAGFSKLRLDVDLGDHPGQTVRIFGEPCPSEPLLELRVRRDLSTIAGLELLRVEWLMLQNPEARFGPARAPLPGQRHPGLGLLREVVAMLVMMCERLRLAGIVFSPAHYHLAVQSRKLLRFLDPYCEARFRAMRTVLEKLPLAEATRAVDEGRVVDRRTGEVVGWTPAPMLLPVGPEARSRLEDPDYERSVAAFMREMSFEYLDGRLHGG